MLVVGRSATGTTVGELGVVDVVSGFDFPVETLCSWAVLWKLEVQFLADSVGEGVIEGSLNRRRSGRRQEGNSCSPQSGGG